MKSVWVGFWRFWLHRKMGWQVRGSLDAYPQDLIVLVGPQDDRLTARVIRVWRRGWKFSANRIVWCMNSADLSEEALAEKLQKNAPSGSWLVPIGIDAGRLKINIHTPFHRSAHPKRDAAYIARYFDYHRKRI